MCPQAEQESKFLRKLGVVNLVVLACVLRVTTKKNFLEEEKCISPEKILAMPMAIISD